MAEAMLQEDGWQYAPVEGQSTLAMGFRGRNGSWMCYAHIDDERGVLVIYSVTAKAVPEVTRQVMADFLTRANFGLVIGNFEMDFSDGETRFKTSVELGQTEATAVLLRKLLHVNVATLDRYLPGIEGVAEGQLHPIEAIALCEQQDS
jgi:hypothetical protein